MERLLTGAFPVAAPVPAAALLLLITRVLSVDDVGTGMSLSYASNTCAKARHVRAAMGLVSHFLEGTTIVHWAIRYRNRSFAVYKESSY